MKPIRGLIDFYKLQAEILWKWRPGRRALIRRLIVSFIVAFIALTLTVAIIPGLHVNDWLTMALAVIAFALINALIRPVILFALREHLDDRGHRRDVRVPDPRLLPGRVAAPGVRDRPAHLGAARVDLLRGLQHHPLGDLLA